MKQGRNDAKVPLFWIPMWALQGVARVFAYGARKYAPGNWQRAGHEEGADEGGPLNDYQSAALRHWAAIQAACPVGVADWGAVDDESGLPHIDHLICSLLMLRGIGQLAGLLPADPGRGNDPRKPLSDAELAPAWVPQPGDRIRSIDPEIDDIDGDKLGPAAHVDMGEPEHHDGDRLRWSTSTARKTPLSAGGAVMFCSKAGCSQAAGHAGKCDPPPYGAVSGDPT